MPDNIESLRRSSVEVIDLPIGNLEPDPRNPNRVEPELFEALARDITEFGFFQPVVVRPRGKDTYRIIDGEHRWRVLKDAGYETVPCVVDDGGEDAQAHMRMLTMNQLRGRFRPVRLARLLAKLADAIGEEELRMRLGMPPEEWEETIALKDAPEDSAALQKALEKEAREAPEVMRFRVGPRQAQVIEQALDDLSGDGAQTRAEALLTLLEGIDA